MQTTPMVDMATHFEIQRFLTAEARMLDERHYDQWVELFTNDVQYWAPTRRTRMVSNKPGDLAIDHELSKEDEPYNLNESLIELKIRVSRIHTARQLWCENPPARNRHLITNIEAWEGDTPGEFKVSSSFVVFHARFDHKGDTFYGERQDVLRRVDGAFRIARRKIILDSTVIWAGALTTFF